MPRTLRFPAVTLTAIGLTILVYLLVLAQGLPPAVGSMRLNRAWVYASAWPIWSGGYWALLTSKFVHVGVGSPLYGFLQALVDLMGLWVFGRRVEAVFGHAATCGLLLFGGLVSSSANIAVGAFPAPGFGASGMIMALVGFMVALRRRSLPIAEMFVIREHARFMMFWVLVVVGGSMLGAFPIHNAAHLAGWVFGYLAGRAFVGGQSRTPAMVGLAAMVGLTVVSLTWAPWLPAWNLWHIDRQLLRGRTPAAKLEIDALLGRMGPDANVDNGIAWMLATTEDAEARDGRRAIELARQACAETAWLEPGVIDTLAAAYAETGQWSKALAMQRLAIGQAGYMGESPASVSLYTGHLAQIQHKQPIRE